MLHGQWYSPSLLIEKFLFAGAATAIKTAMNIPAHSYDAFGTVALYLL